MGKAPTDLWPADKAAIRNVYLAGGVRRRFVPTHNGDGMEHPIEILYRAASAYRIGHTIKNATRRVPGGMTVSEILVAAGILPTSERNQKS